MKNWKVILGFIVVVLIIGRVGYWETHYDREGVVIANNVTSEGCIVVVEDKIGETWDFIADCEHDYPTGSKVKMRMDTMDTTSIYDDEIEKVKIIK